MSFLESILMGLIQGLTEFLPVSSSGHLAIISNIFNINTEIGILFDILLHLGTLVPIFIVYFSDIKELIIEGFSILGLWAQNAFIFIKNIFIKEKIEYKKVITKPYRRFVILVILSTIVTGIIAIVFEKYIDSAGDTLLIPGLGLLFTGTILLISDRVNKGTKDESTTTYGDSLKIGLAQAVATLPGISRSGSTITAGLLCGLDRTYAVKYSFIMSIPAILGAVVLKLRDLSGVTFTSSMIVNYLSGMIMASIIGYICIKTLLVIVRKSKFKYFAYYCFLAGAVSLIYYFAV